MTQALILPVTSNDIPTGEWVVIPPGPFNPDALTFHPSRTAAELSLLPMPTLADMTRSNTTPAKPAKAPQRVLTLTWHQDQGHGWIEAPRYLLADLGILPLVSRFSYASWDGMTIYLEEDVDAGMLADALQAQRGTAIATRPSYTGHSFVRDLPRFHAPASN